MNGCSKYKASRRPVVRNTCYNCLMPFASSEPRMFCDECEKASEFVRKWISDNYRWKRKKESK